MTLARVLSLNGSRINPPIRLKFFSIRTEDYAIGETGTFAQRK